MVPSNAPRENKSSTRAAQEEHKRVIRYLLACGSHEGGYVVALGWPSSLQVSAFRFHSSSVTQPSSFVPRGFAPDFLHSGFFLLLRLSPSSANPVRKGLPPRSPESMPTAGAVLWETRNMEWKPRPQTACWLAPG